ncbi:MAG: cytochrome c biogenesis protein CcsA [Tannerella sp.]|jgi:ABC-type transport system involved in cytochrome c biogenesis permease subunit|nr:cytochrome c biogenesis protein CcsA [Tannerella sp.]
MKIIKRISFALLGVILLALVAATVLEKIYGTGYIYGTVPFVLLWMTFALFAAVYLWMRKVRKHFGTALLHFSFLLILAGAFITWMYGEQGLLHVRKGSDTSMFTDHEGVPKVLPFHVRLDDFRVVYYTGTRAPMDFVSTVTLSGVNGDSLARGEVAMNRIFPYRGYRFYQSGYDADGEGVTLAVSHDPYGIAVTYTGYILLLLSFAGFFFSRRSRFRRLLKHPLLKRNTTVCLLLFCLHAIPAAGTQAAAQKEKPVSAPNVLPRDVAAQFGDLYVLYNDRICPLQTLAKDFTLKLYGRSSCKGLTPEQVFTGWIFYYSSWKEQPVFRIKSKTARQLLGIHGQYASLDDFYSPYNEYKLEQPLQKIHLGEKVKDGKGIAEADEKYNLPLILYSGKLLKIYPHAVGEHLHWYAQGDDLAEDLADDEWFFVKKSFDYMHEMVVKKDYEGLSEMLVKLKAYQQKKAGGALPSAHRFRAEKIYNSLHYTKFFAMLCMLTGLLSFLYYCNRPVRHKKAGAGLNVLLVSVFLYLTLVIGLRWYVGNHVPLSNGFETMQFMAWCAVLLSFLLQGRFYLSLPSGLLLCGLTLLVAMLGESNPRITQLMPVLYSPLLSIHVAVIMVSYSLFAFIMLNGLAAMILSLMKNDSAVQIERLHAVSQIILYPAVFLLATGIFVGAVWANISWGRYWGWDPKEVWALVTMLVYSLALHPDSLPLFRRPMFFHVFAVVAFFSVLITYFGVNFILGGMHSYA